MWESTLVTTTDVPAERLWAVAADIPNWPAWQPGVDRVRVAPGGRSVILWEDGRPVRAAVEELNQPSRLVVVAPLVLARTRTVYELTPVAGGTRIAVTVQLLGPLYFAYRWSFGDRLERRLPALVRQLIVTAVRGIPSHFHGEPLTGPLVPDCPAS
jgi:polyketide cyclase/dehydrase/lipid transport protein